MDVSRARGRVTGTKASRSYSKSLKAPHQLLVGPSSWRLEKAENLHEFYISKQNLHSRLLVKFLSDVQTNYSMYHPSLMALRHVLRTHLSIQCISDLYSRWIRHAARRQHHSALRLLVLSFVRYEMYARQEWPPLSLARKELPDSRLAYA